MESRDGGHRKIWEDITRETCGMCCISSGWLVDNLLRIGPIEVYRSNHWCLLERTLATIRIPARQSLEDRRARE